MDWRLGFPSLVFLEHGLECVEQVSTIVWAGGSFRVVLNAKCGDFKMPYAGDGVIVQVAMGDFQAGWHGRFFDGEAMVLGSDFDATGIAMKDRLVCAAVPEFEFEGLCAAREGEELVSQTDAEDRSFAEEFSDGLLSVEQWFWVTRAVA